MIVNYSIQKQPPSSNTINLNISHTQNAKSVAPTTRDKVKSTNYDLNNFNSEKHVQLAKSDKNQQKQFKIRTCSNNKGKQGVTTLVGRPINHVISVEQKVRQQMAVDQEMAKMIIKRVSATYSQPQGDLSKKHVEVARPNGKKNQVFDQIDNFKRVAPTPLEFQSWNMDILMPLAHKVKLSRNDFNGLGASLTRKYTLIVSFKLLNQESKKYRQKNRPQSSQSIQQQSPFSAQTTNLLKSLCGPQPQKSFLNRCKLYLKVSDESEMSLLQAFLYQNNIHNYAGIINVQDKYAEDNNLYHLKGIAMKDQTVIVLEDRHALQHELPVFNGQHYLFLLPKHSNYFAVNQVIDNIKNISAENVTSPSKSPVRMGKCTEITDDSDKQNMSPNRYHLRFMKSSSKKETFSSTISPSKKALNLTQTLEIKGKLTLRSYDIGLSKLIQKSKCVTASKNIKNRSKSIAKDTSRDQSVKSTRNKSVSKQKKGQSCEQASRVSLQGSFKDKMVALVKILEAEKKQSLYRKPQKFEGSREVQSNMVEQLTSNLTCKLRNKTSYQVVGQLLRNNSHIARQISKYISQRTVLPENQSEVFDRVAKEPTQLELMVYDCE